MGYWRDYLTGARCRLAMSQWMPLPLTVYCFSKIQIGISFLVPAHAGSPGQRAVKRVCVCVCWRRRQAVAFKMFVRACGRRDIEKDVTLSRKL